ncbi:fam-a protein [Plasmodium chabaudi adami]|uniref:Fam-a protein n=1 Tax=Plasmodium chabaudi adami TaxID=5826 RepID=A0A1D3LAW9_PLACE|nr:fam-a protein [Plasmodium chabaudi adami]
MNKFYIQIVFFLLSITLYANNKTLATEPALGKATKSKSKESYLTPIEIYLKNTDLLCNNRNEVINAEKLMNDAVKHLEYHATSEDGYEFVWEDPFKKLFYYQKEHEGHIKFNKFKYPVRDSDKYNEEINKLWDPYVGNLLDYVSTKRKIERVYSPNLIMIQQRYRNCCFGLQRYFYALVKKTQISKDKTIIAMTSANIIDHHPSTKKYKNKIIESANLFTTEVDSEDDIRNGKIKKTYVNIAGYLIEKKGDDLEITYIDAIDGNTPF